MSANAYLQCPKCGDNILTSGVSLIKFCHRDGAKLVAKTMQCPCGTYMDFRYDKFCSHCGLPARDAKVTVVEV